MNLFVVESPGKVAKTSKILGKDFVVRATKGHFRDLDKKKMSIDFDNDFAPMYVITKPDVARDLTRAMKGIKCLYIASDLDMEGEAIGQHIYEHLRPKNYKRVIFSSVTRDAILKAIENAGKLDQDLVDAQKTRRVLDRLFGYMISPVLRRRLGGNLSAGRVQSVATKIIIARENEIIEFVEKNEGSSSFRVTGVFGKKLQCQLHSTTQPEAPYKSHPITLPKKDRTVKKLLGKMAKADWTVGSVRSKESIRNPSPPFETSTLQQEANRKFGMSVDTTMKLAQLLYESGYITYMRTDSVSMSKEGHAKIKETIIETYGKSEYEYRQYETKSASAQEAHEAIRPTEPSLESLAKKLDNPAACRLYRLIRQRTLASQMKSATLDICTIQIEPDTPIELEDESKIFFQSTIETITDPGFMAVYVESTDDEEVKEDQAGMKPPREGRPISMVSITAKEEYRRAPPRYTEATLVKALKTLRIGRPGTYASIIKTIMNHSYVSLEDVRGVKKEISIFSVSAEDPEVTCETDTVFVGQEKKKLCPTPLGRTVTEFLEEHFTEMMDYQFTANMEEELDTIAKGKKVWNRVVRKYHRRLESKVKELMAAPFERPERYVGKAEGIKYYALKTKYGPAIKKDVEPKPVYANIPTGMTEESITLKQALRLFDYPKVLGEYRGNIVEVRKGRYGFYINWNGKNYPADHGEVDLGGAILKIKEALSKNFGVFKLKEGGKEIKVEALQGNFGNYLRVTTATKKWNCPIPRGTDPKKLTKSGVQAILRARAKKRPGK